MLVTHLKIKITINAYEIIFLPLSLIIGKLTLLLKLTAYNWFEWTTIFYVVRVQDGDNTYVASS